MCLHLRLVGQIRDNVPVGLEPSQNVGLYKVSQGRVFVPLPCLQAFDEILEFGCRSKESRAEKVEDRPEIGEPVFLPVCL